MDFLSLIRRFMEADAHVVLIGGLAAVLHGVPIVTNDIDLCYETSADNREKVVAALAPLHPALRVAGMTEDEARSLPFFWDNRTLRDTPNVTLHTDAGNVDLLATVQGVGSFTDVLAAADTLDVGGVIITVLDLPGLIAAKTAAGRPKDLLALPLIEATLLERDADNEE